jgi:2-methylcitrate dehydratase PrpD
MTKPFQVGRAAQSGVVAVQAALAGMTATPDVIESKQGLLHALSARGKIDLAPPHALHELPGLRKYGLNIKLSPICYAGHRIVDAVVELRSRWAADTAKSPDVRVDRIDVELGDTQSAILREHDDARTPAAAKFSAEFAVAATWLTGECSLAELAPEFIARADVRDLMSRVVRHPVTDRDPIEPMHAPFDRVTIVFSDGTRLTSSDVRYAEGHRLRPASPERLRAKFDSCVAPRLGEAGAASLFDLASDLEGLEDLKVLATAATSGMEGE